MSATRSRCERRSISHAATSSRSREPARESGTASGGNRPYYGGRHHDSQAFLFRVAADRDGSARANLPRQADPARGAFPRGRIGGRDGAPRRPVLVGGPRSTDSGGQPRRRGRDDRQRSGGEGSPGRLHAPLGNVGPLAIGPGLYKKLGYDV